VTAPGRLFLWGYFEGAQAPPGYSTLGRIGDLGFLAMPTDAGLFIAGVAYSMNERERWLADTERALDAGLARVEEVAEVLSSAKRVGRIRVMARWNGYFRQATGPGWVLVGDAGHFKDPTPTQGISDALRQGEKLAHAIEAGLGAGQLEDQLMEWWRWRDADAWDMYWFATDMGAAGASPGIVGAMMGDLSTDADGPERFLRVLNHDLALGGVRTRPSRTDIGSDRSPQSTSLRASADRVRSTCRHRTATQTDAEAESNRRSADYGTPRWREHRMSRRPMR
jgi:2-polyprenyl-6-methoxyphenol hydroxylase-like FAD-dependent oxidoreductase